MISKNQSIIKKIWKISEDSLLKIVKVLSKSEKFELQIKDEWLSTPKLLNVIRTNGKGDFLNVKTGSNLILNPRKNDEAKIWSYINSNGKMEVISLQKFVAMIYHPNLSGSNITEVIDNNKLNLSKDNVRWVTNLNYKY